MAYELAILTIMSIFAFKVKMAVLFEIDFIISLFAGLHFYDIYVSPSGLAVSWALILYSIFCLAMGLYCLFNEEGEFED